MSRNHKGKLQIGIPCELNEYEKRIALTPETVSLLTQLGHEVYLQSGAGMKALYTDDHFRQAGAQICNQVKDVWKCSTIIKVSPPTLQEISMMHSRCTIFSMMPSVPQSKKLVLAMMSRGITAINYHLIEDEQGGRSVLEQQCELEGRVAVMLSANYLMDQTGGKGILLGGCAGVSPTQVVILGADRSGLEAARTALRLGAHVSVFDYRLSMLSKIQKELGIHVFTSTFHPHVFHQSLASADVIIGTLPRRKGQDEYFISISSLDLLKTGAILLDLCSDTDCCVDPLLRYDHACDDLYCISGVRVGFLWNLSSRVSRTSSMSISNHLLPLLLQLSDTNSSDHLYIEHVDMCTGVYIFQGKLVHHEIASYFDIPWSDLSLFMTPMQ